MRIWPQCVPCILGVRLGEIVSSPHLGDGEKIVLVKEFIREFSRYITPAASTVVLATIGFRMVKELTSSEDPYAAFKERSNEEIAVLSSALLDEVPRSRGFERFRKLAVASINANSIDPGAPLGAGPSELGSHLYGGVLEIDHTREIYDRIKRSSRIVYLLDNAGEAVIDKLLVGEISGIVDEVFVMAKGKPYQNDVTLEEALQLGFGKVARVVSTGSDAAGPIPGEISEEAEDLLRSADLIVAKGMANYETYLYFRPPGDVAHLFQAKCLPVASTLNVPPGSSVALLKRV